jgi:hypothetical protein
VAVVAWANLAGAATIPFTDNFDADTIGATTIPGWTAGGSSIYSIVEQTPGDNALQGASAINSGSQGISFTNAVGNAITLSTDARLTNLVSGGAGASANFGFGLFGDTANFSSGTQYRLLLGTIGNAGTLFVVKNGVNQTSVITGQALTIATGTDYTITATVTPVASTLVFHATATDGTKTTILDFTDATPLTGTFFGYRTATAATGTTETVQYDNFSIALAPEPASLSLVGVAGLVLVRRRRA